MVSFTGPAFLPPQFPPHGFAWLQHGPPSLGIALIIARMGNGKCKRVRIAPLKCRSCRKCRYALPCRDPVDDGARDHTSCLGSIIGSTQWAGAQTPFPTNPNRHGPLNEIVAPVASHRDPSHFPTGGIAFGSFCTWPLVGAFHPHNRRAIAVADPPCPLGRA